MTTQETHFGLIRVSYEDFRYVEWKPYESNNGGGNGDDVFEVSDLDSFLDGVIE